MWVDLMVAANLAESDETLASIPALSALRVRDLPSGIVFGDLNSPVSGLLHRMAKRLPDAVAVAFHVFQGLDPAIDADFASKLKNFLPIGPLNLLAPLPPPPAGKADYCISWLDQQNVNPHSVIYISLSTAMMPSPAEIAELACGVESSGAPFLWSLKEKAQEWLPAGFTERTKGRGVVVPWAPQVQVLEHKAVGAFLNHAGWNSVMESIASGVPMVVRPNFGDQQSIARMLSKEWGIGIMLDGKTVTGEETARALNVVLREEEGKRMRERVWELKERAMRAVADGGSSRENLNRVLEITLRVDQTSENCFELPAR